MMAVLLLSYVEKAIRAKTPDILDILVVPILSIIIVGSLTIFAFMPLAGLITNGLMIIFDAMLGSSSLIVTILSGYVLASLFLFLVVFGLHHALIPIYATQLAATGQVTLFPILAMAGAGQVGAAIAI
jgi:PTS system sucrose-specific IIC component